MAVERESSGPVIVICAVNVAAADALNVIHALQMTIVCVPTVACVPFAMVTSYEHRAYRCRSIFIRNSHYLRLLSQFKFKLYPANVLES